MWSVLGIWNSHTDIIITGIMIVLQSTVLTPAPPDHNEEKASPSLCVKSKESIQTNHKRVGISESKMKELLHTCLVVFPSFLPFQTALCLVSHLSPCRGALPFLSLTAFPVPCPRVPGCSLAAFCPAAAPWRRTCTASFSSKQTFMAELWTPRGIDGEVDWSTNSLPLARSHIRTKVRVSFRVNFHLLLWLGLGGRGKKDQEWKDTEWDTLVKFQEEPTQCSSQSDLVTDDKFWHFRKCLNHGSKNQHPWTALWSKGLWEEETPSTALPGRLACLGRVSQRNASSHPTPSHLWWWCEDVWGQPVPLQWLWVGVCCTVSAGWCVLMARGSSGSCFAVMFWSWAKSLAPHGHHGKCLEKSVFWK